MFVNTAFVNACDASVDKAFVNACDAFLNGSVMNHARLLTTATARVAATAADALACC